MNKNDWSRKFKGSRDRGGAWIHTHPDIEDAIVENHHGIRFRGVSYPDLEQAKNAALAGNEKVRGS